MSKNFMKNFTKSIYHDGREYDKLGTAHGAGEDGAGEEGEFYTAHALLGTSTLELACGTGRLTVPLAEQGVNITGIDTSQAMLATAHAKAAQKGVSPPFLEADMRSFSLEQNFDLIFLPNNSLGHLHSLTDIQSCFSCVLRHLSEEGCFIVDMFNPSFSLLMRDRDRHYPITEYRRPDGKRVVVTETVYYDAATQINQSLWHYQSEGEPEDVRLLELRMFFPQELDGLLRLTGFTIEAKYGSFDRSAFSSKSRQQLIVCRKATQPAAVA